MPIVERPAWSGIPRTAARGSTSPDTSARSAAALALRAPGAEQARPDDCMPRAGLAASAGELDVQVSPVLIAGPGNHPPPAPRGLEAVTECRRQRHEGEPTSGNGWVPQISDQDCRSQAYRGRLALPGCQGRRAGLARARCLVGCPEELKREPSRPTPLELAGQGPAGMRPGKIPLPVPPSSDAVPGTCSYR